MRSRRATRVEKRNVIRESNWLLTINTNKRPGTNENADFLCDTLEDAMAEVVDNFDKYFVWKEVPDLGRGNWSTDMKDVNVEYTCEIGSLNRDDFDADVPNNLLSKIGGRVHGHMTIFTKHTMSVHLDYSKIKNDIQKFMTAEGVDFNGKIYVYGLLLKDMSRAFRYLSKGSPHRDILEAQIEESQ